MMAKVTNIVVQLDDDTLKALLDKFSKLEKRVAELELKVRCRR